MKDRSLGLAAGGGCFSAQAQASSALLTAWGRLAIPLGLTMLAACARIIPAPQVAQPPVAVPTFPGQPVPPSMASLAQARPGPHVADLRIGRLDAEGALASFRESCPRLLARTDASGLTRNEDWRAACTAASTWPVGDAPGFFAALFETAEIQGGNAFVTGYFEPEIAGARQRLPGFDVPVYGVPPDLIRAWPPETPETERTGRPPLGRFDAYGRFVPYYERAEIEAGALAGKGLEIAWVADPIDFFFLQIQGSGRLRAPDGSVMRIGYAGQSGREYVSLSRILRERGVPEAQTASMQSLVAWLRAHPEEGRAAMRANKSWVFFRELKGDGPLGALGVPVRTGSSVAADPAYVPLGAPIWLQVDRPEANGLWIAQDTGGAIKGANRFDTFWGAGPGAGAVAGGMSARGRALLLLPKGTLARLGQ